MRTLEDLIKETSGTGLSQAFIVGLNSLCRLTMGWYMMSLSFANFVPKWCCLPDNFTSTPDQYCREEGHLNGSRFAKMCQVNETSCSHRVFATGVRTIVYEWDLVCERRWMLPLTTSIQMTGLLFGAFLAGQMSDLLGRKKTVCFFPTCCAAFSFVAAFSTSWQMFAVAIFLLGAGVGGFLAASVPYITEFVVPSKRGIVTILPSFQVGVCLMALGAWRMEDWTMVYWVSGAMTAPLLLPLLFLPESLRWLTVKGRVDEAQRVVEWVARWNKQEVPKDSLDIIKAVAADVKRAEETSKPTYIHIYKGWHLLKSSLILQFIWFVMSMCTYGFSFGASSFGTNIYLTIFLMYFISMPNFIVVSLGVRRLGCKNTAILFLILASACGFGSLTIKLTLAAWDKKSSAEIALNLLSRGLLSAVWSTISILTNETYPTTVRGLGYGAAGVSARVGAMLSPFLLDFEDGPTLALSVIGGSLLVAAVAVTCLEETSGKAMVDSIKVQSQTADNKLELQERENGIYVIARAADTDSSVVGSGPGLYAERKF